MLAHLDVQHGGCELLLPLHHLCASVEKYEKYVESHVGDVLEEASRCNWVQDLIV